MLEMLSIEHFIILLIYLMYLSYKDIKNKKISIIDVFLGVLLGIAICILTNRNNIQIILGLLIGIITIIISIVSRQALGLGDALVVLILGISTGIGAINTFISALLLFITYILIISCIKRKIVKDDIAFIPFIFLGQIIGIIYEIF